MKLITLTGLTVAISATCAYAQSSIDAITAQLAAEGYDQIEVEVNGATIEFEGYRAGEERELVVDATTWEVLSDETRADLEADDDDDDYEDDDDSDDDEDDDENEVEDGDDDDDKEGDDD